MKMLLYCLVLYGLVFLPKGQPQPDTDTTIGVDRSTLAGRDTLRPRRATSSDCTADILKTCPLVRSSDYTTLKSECNNIKGALTEMDGILTELKNLDDEPDENTKELCASIADHHTLLDSTQQKHEQQHEELSCQVDEMQKRRDAGIRTANVLDLPHTHGEDAPQGAPTYDSTVPIDELQAHVTSYGSESPERKDSLDSLCANANSKFYKDIWHGPYNHDTKGGETSGQYYLSKSAILKKQTNLQIKLYGFNSEGKLIELFNQDTVTHEGLMTAVESSQSAVTDAKIFCKCCAAVTV